MMNDGGSCAGSEPFALQVLGDHMEPEFLDGNIIVVDPDGVIENGSFVVAQLENQEFIFRQLVWDDEKRYFLKALNDKYETMEVSGLQVVKGVVVQKAGRRRKDHKHYV